MKIFVFIGIFAKSNNCETFSFIGIFSKSNSEDFGFYWHFYPILPSEKIFVFIGIFVHVYQRWESWFLLSFLSKSDNGESFDF